MPRRVCLGVPPTPGAPPTCPDQALAPEGKTRCWSCERATDRARGTRQQRGYDADYERARAALHLELGPPCHWGCGRVATTADHWPPQAIARSDTPLVLVPACQRCNSGQVALARWHAQHPDDQPTR